MSKMKINQLPEEVKEYIYWNEALDDAGKSISRLENYKHQVALSLRKMGIIEGLGDKLIENAEKVFDFSIVNERIEEHEKDREKAHNQMEKIRTFAFEVMKEYKNKGMNG